MILYTFRKWNVIGSLLPMMCASKMNCRADVSWKSNIDELCLNTSVYLNPYYAYLWIKICMLHWCGSCCPVRKLSKIKFKHQKTLKKVGWRNWVKSCVSLQFNIKGKFDEITLFFPENLNTKTDNIKVDSKRKRLKANNEEYNEHSNNVTLFIKWESPLLGRCNV